MSLLTTPKAGPQIEGRRANLPGPKFLLGDLETMTRTELERLQQLRLTTMAERTYRRSPLIRKLWNAAGITPTDTPTIEAFFQLAPFTSKDIVRAYRDAEKDPFGGMLCCDPAALPGVGLTSGTTGDPTPVSRFTEGEYARDYWHIGARPGDYHTNVLFTFRSGVMKRFLTDIGVTPILFTHAPREIARIVEASLRFRPTTMGMISSPLLNAFEDYFNLSGHDPRDVFASYRGGLFGGEPLAGKYLTMTRDWGLELFETTSIGDVNSATECWAHDGMHCCEDQVLLECLDPLGSSPVADGTVGELVVTALSEPALPVIRYRTDDLVMLDRRPCICGRSHARIRVVGRKGDLVTIAGRSILPRDIFPLIHGVKGVSHGLFQIVRSGIPRGVLLLRIGYDAGLDEAATAHLADTMRDRVQHDLNVPVEIELRPQEDLLKLGPPHKIPRIAAT